MHRIDTTNRELNKFGTGKDGWTNGVVATGTPPTESDEEWFDSVQEEIANVVEYKQALVKTDRAQLLDTIMKITLGKIWDRFAVDLTFVANGICYADEALVLVGDGGEIYSTNKYISEYTAETSGIATNLNNVDYDSTNEILIAVGDSGIILKSTNNGTTWSSITSGTSNKLYNVKSDNNGNWVICGASGTVLESSDSGSTWTVRTSTVSTILRSISWDLSNSIWIIVGDSNGTNGTVITSTDRATWTDRSTGGNYDWYAVASDSNGDSFFVGESGKGFYSSNGTTWISSSPASSSSARLQGIVYCGINEKWYATADGEDQIFETIQGLPGAWLPRKPFGDYLQDFDMSNLIIAENKIVGIVVGLPVIYYSP